MPKARIISGTHRSRIFETGAFSHTRPTKDRVKESMFNQLMPLIRFHQGLDLFAGVGSLGFEALSRGVRQMTFVEAHRETFKVLKKNMMDLDFKAPLKNIDAFKFLTSDTATYDLIILDPPYQSEALEKALMVIFSKQKLNPGGLIVGLHEKPITPENFQTVKQRRVGRTQISIWEPL